MALAFSTTATVGMHLSDDRSTALYPLIAQVFGACVVSVPAGKLMARYGRSIVFMIGSTIGLVGAALCAYSVYTQQFWLLVASTPFLGMYNGFGEFAKYAAADACDDERRKSRTIAIVVSGGIVAAFVGPAIASYANDYLMTEYPYLGPYLTAFVLISLSLVLYSRLTVKAHQITASDNATGTLASVLKNRLFVCGTVVGASSYLIMAAMMDAFPMTMIEGGYHFSHTTSVLQWHLLAMFAPSYLTALFIGRFGASSAIAVGVALNFAGLMAALQNTSYINFWLCLFFIGLGWNFMYLVAADLITRIDPVLRSRAEGANNFAIMTSFGLSTPLAAFILINYGWYRVAHFSLILLAIAAIVTILCAPFIRHQANSADIAT